MKETKRKCLKCGDSPGDNFRVILHRFPKPGRTNKLRCESWAKFCFPDRDWHLPEFQKKLFSEHRMLCNKHFRTTSFMDISRRRLIKTATPDPESEKIFNETKNLNVSETGVTEKTEPSQNISQMSKPLLYNTTLLNTEEASEGFELQESNDSEKIYSIYQESVLEETTEFPSKNYKSLYTKCQRQLKKIKQLRNIIRKLKEKLQIRKISTHTVLKTKFKKF
ncbi:uncharacterized protein LOC119834541 [Zerene cesonia]|uniref:uncharacterized protein LOC119834541 n=1 Tax=Zerene cesonia TaxID=33412 RepID=UPI0018E52F70|nr:uncharacterized protein LOC119834541 [Zerene cesonia]